MWRGQLGGLRVKKGVEGEEGGGGRLPLAV